MMTRYRLYHVEPKLVRDYLQQASQTATRMQELEQLLIQQLIEIDKNRFYVRLGFKSLRTFCIRGLKFTRTQGQRIVTEVRRHQTTSDIGHEGNIHGDQALRGS